MNARDFTFLLSLVPGARVERIRSGEVVTVRARPIAGSVVTDQGVLPVTWLSPIKNLQRQPRANGDQAPWATTPAGGQDRPAPSHAVGPSHTKGGDHHAPRNARSSSRAPGGTGKGGYVTTSGVARMAGADCDAAVTRPAYSPDHAVGPAPCTDMLDACDRLCEQRRAEHEQHSDALPALSTLTDTVRPPAGGAQ